MKWTKEQSLAISTVDKTLLVSAAAGSGKTATLTERIIHSILDENIQADIGRMLIVTYTNAAVDELRMRIGKAIKTAAVAHPENGRLEEQLLRLKDAKIMTITAFCNSILRSCAESAGINPSYRIAEPAEAKIMSSSIMEALINSAYEGEESDICTADEFLALSDTLCDAKYSEGLADAFSYVYDKLESSEAGIDSLIPLIDEYSPEKFTNPDSTRMGHHIIEEAKSALSAYRDAYRKTMTLASAEALDLKNMEAAEGDILFIEECLLKETYEDIRAAVLNFSPKSLSRSSGSETDFYSSFKKIRSLLVDDIKSFKNDFFSYSSDEWRILYTKVHKILTIFYKFLKKFYDTFMNEKRRAGICEFSDIERYTYLALYDENGNTTPLAHEISERFDAIYVDEYQDVNALQDKIFAAIATPTNRFMVGDIKQSIYGFRSARPEIFAEMKKKFPLLSSDNDSPSASIFMSDNFRCDKTVVDFVNGIFDTAFGMLGKNIGYVCDDRLKFSKAYPDGSTPIGVPPTIYILEKAKRDSTLPVDADAATDEATEEDNSNAAVMARAICKKISELLESGKLADGGKIQPKHIAILVRSIKGAHTTAITEELKKIGVSASLTDDSNLFISPEVMLALSYLYSIDNPRKDIYLVSLMCSPLFDFTADEVLKIRRSSSAPSVYEALLEYSESNPDFEKGKRLIGDLKKYKKLSEWLPTDKLIQTIYRESGLFALASASGGQDNLILLHSHASKHEKAEFRGLYSFISYLDALIDKGEKYPAANESDDENAVRIMTVHKSKGLEFPVCIIANASAKSHGKDKGRIVLSEGFGISVKVKDDSGIALVSNPTMKAIERKIASDDYDEELRVLYVALTRAREQLYIYATSPKKDADEYIESIESTRDILSPYFLKQAKSFLDIILLCKQDGKTIICSSDGETALPNEGIDSDTESFENAEKHTEPEDDFYDESLSDELIKRFTYVYPKKHLCTIPKKISISKLSPRILDDESDEDVELDEVLRYEQLDRQKAKKESNLNSSTQRNEMDADTKASILPKFISGINKRESAERGIATHMVLQFCDFARLRQNGTEAELKKLCDDEFISDNDIKKVRTSEIDAFTKSDIFEEILEAKKLYRELRFNLMLPASNFTEDLQKKELLKNKKILVQGVIDCIIENEQGELHLIDYKTDRLSKAELEDERLADERLRKSHSRQLLYYAEAIEMIFGKRPSKVGVYSLCSGRETEIIQR